MMLLAAFGLVASDWQREVALPNAPPTFVGAAPAARPSAIAGAAGPHVDLSAVDPLAPRYKEWAERAAQFKTDGAATRRDAAFRRRPARPRRAGQGDQGRAGLGLRRRARRRSSPR